MVRSKCLGQALAAGSDHARGAAAVAHRLSDRENLPVRQELQARGKQLV